MTQPGALAWILLASFSFAPGCGRHASPGAQESAPAVDTVREVRVRIVGPDGAPTATEGAVIWWGEGAAAEYGTPLPFAPDETGGMVLHGLPRTPLTVCALPRGFVVPTRGTPRTVLGPSEVEAVLVLDPATERVVRVLGWSQHRSGLAYLAALDDLEPSQHGIEDDGTLRLTGLRPGATYNLYVRDFETGAAALLRGLRFAAPWPDIELAPGSVVTGVVRLPDGCDSATVALLVDKAVLIDGASSDEGDGTFELHSVPQGTYTCVAYTTHKGRYLAGTAQVQAGGRVTIDLRTR